MLTEKTLSLDQALHAITTTIDHAKANDHAGICVVVMDKNGEVIAAAKMDNRSNRYFKAAYRKCYSAALFRRDTSAIVELHQNLDEAGHYGPIEWNDPLLTTLPGGYVVCEGDTVLGAIAVSGGGGKISDWEFAEIAFAALGDGYTHRPGRHD